MTPYQNTTGHIIWLNGQMILPGDTRMVDLPQPEWDPEVMPSSDSVAGEAILKQRKKNG